MSIETPSLFTPISFTTTGAFKVVDGSAADPSYSFTDDTDTGIFSAENGAVSITVDGEEKVRIAETVQIGTWSEDAGSALSVNSTTGGFRPPRLNVTQRNAIAAPKIGTLIYNTDSARLEVWSGAYWSAIGGGGGGSFPLEAPDGDASEPSYTFGTSTSSGIYSSGSDTVNISAGGANKLQVGTSAIETGADVLPTADSTYSIGSGAKKWANVYAGSIDTGGLTSGTILPTDDSTDDIGSEAKKWANVHADSVDATSLTGTLQTAAQPNITAVGILSSLTCGHIVPVMDSAYNLGAGDRRWEFIYGDNVMSGYFFAAGGGGYYGSIRSPTQPYITSVGTLTSLTSGTILPTADSTDDIGSNAVRWANVYADSVDATNLTGTLQTAAQPNITSVGVLSYLSCGSVIPSADATHNLGAGIARWKQIYATDVFIDNLYTLTVYGTIKTAAQPDITSVGVLTSLTSGTILPTADSTDDIGSNAARWANIYTDSLDATSITGTLQTAAQTNITSVGTLSGLTLGGDFMPSADSSHNMGSNFNRWSTIYTDNIRATVTFGSNYTGNLMPLISGSPDLGSSSKKFGKAYAEEGYFDSAEISSLTATSLSSFPTNSSLTTIAGNLQIASQGVGTSELEDSSVTDAKIVSVSASKLTGNFDAHIIPSAASTYGIGESKTPWSIVYATTIQATNVNGTLGTAAQPNITSLGNLTSLYVENGINATLVAPHSDSTGTLGTGALRWGNVYADALDATSITGTLQTAAQTNITSVGTLTSLTSGTILPTADSTYNLGSNAVRWADIYADSVTTVDVVATELTGTLQTASQTNITSVGILNGLATAGNILPSSDFSYNIGSSSLRWGEVWSSVHYVQDSDTKFSRPSSDLVLENDAGDFVFTSTTPELKIIDKSASWATSQIDLIMGWGGAPSSDEYTSIRVSEDSLMGYYVSTDAATVFEWMHIDAQSLASPTSNVGIGVQIYGALSTGEMNSVFGTQCGNSLTTQDANTYVGYIAGKSATGQYCTFIGAESGETCTGVSNNAVGWHSLYQGTSTDNCAFGHRALQSLTGGARNIGIGTVACDNISSGSDNIGIGYYTLASGSAAITTGLNIAIGPQAGRYLANQSYNNIFIGQRAGRAFGTDCRYNVVIGTSHSGLTDGSIDLNDSPSEVEGQNQVIVGHNNVTHQQGDRNVIIGNDLGGSNMTSGTDNILIGNNIQPAGNITNTIIIHSTAPDDVYNYGGGSNAIVIGQDQTNCWIRGIYNSVATAFTVYVDSTGKLTRAASSLRYKKDVDYDAHLEWREKFLQLRPVQYHMKDDSEDKSWHYSFIAEDVHEVEPTWCVFDGEGWPDSLRFIEISCVTASVVQEHDAEIKDLQARIAVLEQKLANLESPP
jgi:hypothetical protein